MTEGGARSRQVGVVIVNWNGWPDTLECLEAVFRVDGLRGPVVVCDNGSTDGSCEMIVAWARGHLCAVPQNRTSTIAGLVIPPVPKPIAFTCLTVDEIQETPPDRSEQCSLVVLRARENRGFAAANNAAIEVLLRRKDIRYLWFINNDALPRKDALTELLAATAACPEPLISGSVLMEYWDVSRIQALGGRYKRYAGLTSPLLEGASVHDLNALPRAVSVDYPMGAAMLVSRSFVERVGAMCEEYFLYFEEIDWVFRFGWPSKAVAAPRSIVYHKGGSSTQGGRSPAERSLKADYYMLRGRLLLARKLSLTAFSITLLVNLISIIRRMMRPRPGVVVTALQATWDGLAGVTGKRDRWP